MGDALRQAIIWIAQILGRSPPRANPQAVTAPGGPSLMDDLASSTLGAASQSAQVAQSPAGQHVFHLAAQRALAADQQLRQRTETEWQQVRDQVPGAPQIQRQHRALVRTAADWYAYSQLHWRPQQQSDQGVGWGDLLPGYDPQNVTQDQSSFIQQWTRRRQDMTSPGYRPSNPQEQELHNLLQQNPALSAPEMAMAARRIESGAPAREPEQPPERESAFGWIKRHRREAAETMAAAEYAQWQATKAAQAVGVASSPFIGDANSQVVGSMGSSAAQFATGAATLAMSGGNPLLVAKGLAEMGKELLTLPANIRNWSKSLIDSQFAMREYSAGIAQVAFQADIREILRAQQSGEAVKDTLGILSNEYQSFSDYWRPTKDSATNFLNIEMARSLREIRGFTEDETKIRESPEFAEQKAEWERQFREKLKQRSLLRKSFFSEWQEIEMAEDAAEMEIEQRLAKQTGASTYRAFEDWMRAWQDGKMGHQSQRPMPKP